MLLIAFLIVLVPGLDATCDPIRVDPYVKTPSVSVKCRAPLRIVDLPVNVEKVEFDQLALVDLDILAREQLNNFPNLTELTLIASNFSDLANITFTFLLQQITVLALIDDHIQRLPSALLNDFNASHLTHLDVSRNAIECLDANTFRTVDQLTVLNLSSNNLQQVQNDTFAGLDQLQHLDLANNKLRHLNSNTFAPLLALQYLNLSNNRLEIIDEECFTTLQRLQQLDVSWNRLVRVAPGSLQLPSLARLLLADNPALGQPVPLLVGPGKRLQILDASRTGLRQVPAALTHSIRTLRLAGNAIRAVSRGHLDSYPLLQLLDFTANALEEIEEDALGRLELLAILYLTDNRLRAIPRNLPEKLLALHLEHNRIERISAADFQYGTNLQVLLLNDNRITEIDDGVFQQMHALATLDLSRNPILGLPAAALSGPVRLRVLRMAAIRTISSSVPDQQFPLPNPERLITLDLSESPALARQFLTDSATLVAARELQELNLADTHIDSLRSDLFHYLPQLRALQIDGNAFNCSQLEWLAAWLRQQDQAYNRHVMCAAPPELFGTPLIDLQQQVDAVQYEPVSEKSTSSSSGWHQKSSSITRNAIDLFGNRVMEMRRKGTTPGYGEAAKGFNQKVVKKDLNKLNVTSGRRTINKELPFLVGAKSTEIPTTISTNGTIAAGYKLEMSAKKPNNFQHQSVFAVLCSSVGIVCTLMFYIAIRKRRVARVQQRQHQQHDIEISSLPSVTELW